MNRRQRLMPDRARKDLPGGRLFARLVAATISSRRTARKKGDSPMSDLSRRDFLGHSAAAVGALALTNDLPAADAPPKLKSAADQVTLGKTGVKTSLLGLGTGSVGVKRSS